MFQLMVQNYLLLPNTTNYLDNLTHFIDKTPTKHIHPMKKAD